MTISKKFNSALLAVGFIAVLAVAASPASAQTLPLTGTLAGTLSAYKANSKTGQFKAELSSLPVGARASAKVLLGKRVLCKTAKAKQVTEGGTIGIGCNFPLRNLAAKKSSAKTTQAGQGQIVTARLELLASGQAVMPAPVIILIPISIAAFSSLE